MTIVDTFTQLIFGDDEHFTEAELRVIQAFRQVEHSVLFDSTAEMGCYLRAMGVEEMTRAVGQVHRLLNCEPVIVPGMSATLTQVKSPQRRAH